MIPPPTWQLLTLKRVSIATTWDAIYRMFPDIRSRINFGANDINDTRNVMTMD
jgi:hypothetical protein